MLKYYVYALLFHRSTLYPPGGLTLNPDLIFEIGSYFVAL
jgi:hypothetical protein